MSEHSEADTDLQPSKLGTKEYWDNIYEQEIGNFEDFGDEGEVWFGRESVEKIVDWALSNVPPSASTDTSGGNSPTTIIEIGSGNGNLLFALADAGYEPGGMAGVDYSADAVRLARNVGNEKGGGGGYGRVRFGEVDFLAPAPEEYLDAIPRVLGRNGDEEKKGWTLVLDKGTYDAMALAERDEEGHRPCDVYPRRVGGLVEMGGFFLITSCNFTREELLRTFETSETGLKYHSQIKYPSISFGGVQGSTYCSIAFQKATKIQ